ncbi:hypothetical protein CEUSTIGMA_g11518.t1 [Chlamydomonas eustigma]|uniref:Thioredoxin domain-containing protein n=1 Tax=Chlamydomonas eustigma TaxID=1157962 RepID=A0A250XLW6_9CHLO|nr:hypothetical protein CEUSTIGMA_g11518.t1 [Chlamydomonas eustigma]|eukprot:GAX84095.1 hypothetical protein CEUSTIGMA_g11518.t1 [Chlamydomonas eustigma]
MLANSALFQAMTIATPARTLAFSASGLLLSVFSGNRTFAQAASAGSPSAVVDMSDDKTFDQLIQKSNQLVVVDFTAKWCGPCRMIAPIYDQLSIQHPTVTFTKVDIDNPDLAGTASSHSITGVPTFVFYKNGKRLETFSGAQKDLLINLVDKHK